MKHNWEYKPFDDVAVTISPTSKVEKSSYETTGLFPIVSQEDCYISGYWNNPNDLTRLDKPVIIFGDHSRVLKYVDFDFVVGADGVKIIKPKDNVNPKFLYHYLNWYKIPSLGYSRHFKLIKKALFPIPPFDWQNKIIEELDLVSNLIEDCREVLHDLDSLAQSLFYDYFGDPVSNPKSWETRSFENCIYKVKYPSKLQTQEYSNTGNFPIVSQEEVLISGYTNRKDCIYFIDKPVVIFGDHTRCLKFIDFDFALGADGVKILSPIQLFNAHYFYYLLLLFKIPSLGYSRHYKLLKDLQIPIPPLELQEKFAERIEQINTQKKAVEETIANLQTLLDSRMDYWFN